MSAFNEIERRAVLRRTSSCCGDVLRGEWGFDGFVVSDWDVDVAKLIAHGFAAT